MTSRLDHEALKYGYEKIIHGPDKKAAKRLKEMAAEDGWQAAAERAASQLQVEALHLRPWEQPPCYARPGGSLPENKLLDKLLAAGFSRWHADPTEVLVGSRPVRPDKHERNTLRAL
jgi:hypothetical protein